MKITTIVLFPIVISFVLISCSNYTSNQILLINEAGKNKKEVKNIIKEATNASDSLLKESFNYILENISHHKSIYQEGTLYEDIFKSFILLDSVAKNHCTERDKRPWESTCHNNLLESREIAQKMLSNTLPSDTSFHSVADLEIIGSEWLSDHINLAIDNWKNSPYSNNLTKEEFQETLLPYRYLDEYLDISSSELNELYFNYLTDNGRNSIEQVIDILNYYLSSIEYANRKKDNIANDGFYRIVQWNSIGCREQSVIAAQILNSCGIPANIDFTSHWLNRDIRHYWLTIQDPAGNWLPFSAQWQALYDSSFYKKTSKVFRITYANNLNSAYYKKNKNEIIPIIFNNPLMKDVTAGYHTVVDLELPYTGQGENNLAYLSVFSPKGITPVAWGEIHKEEQKVAYQKVPVGVVYFPTDYSDNRESIPFSAPFYLRENGTIEYIRPNKEKTCNLILTSKRPQKAVHLKKWLDALVGSWFEGANNPDFSDARKIHILKSPPKRYVEEFATLNSGPFRYVRFVTGHNDEMNMAIMEYFTTSDKEISENYGTLPHVLHPSKKELWTEAKKYSLLEGKLIGDIEDLEGGFDGELLTCTIARWAGIDFGKPQMVDKIRCAGRNADNMIVVGDTYQLLYYDNGWIEYGKQVAKYNYLEFKNIPSGTIYWLRNLSEGEEELSFFYENGKQIFINHDNMEDIEFLK